MIQLVDKKNTQIDIRGKKFVFSEKSKNILKSSQKKKLWERTKLNEESTRYREEQI